jgi:hypothetical protein
MAGVQQDAKRVSHSKVLDREFVPLPIAAAAAYYKVTGMTRRLEEDRLGETIHLMAIALSTVAPIYMATVGGAFVLSAAEIREFLYRPVRSNAPPDLDCLRIRKADMERGIDTLKASRNAFWERGW